MCRSCPPAKGASPLGSAANPRMPHSDRRKSRWKLEKSLSRAFSVRIYFFSQSAKPSSFVSSFTTR